jgi:uncharacterized protein (TIRG00374 family)
VAEIARALPAPPALRDALTPRRVALVAGIAAAVVASVALLLPALADLPDAGSRIAGGDAHWLLLALGLEALSFVGHIVLFRAVSLGAGSRIGMRESYQITLAGHAATRLFASAGAGGVALTAWALRRSGMEREEVGRRMVTFIVLLYSVYMAALILGGIALFTGVLPGTSPVALTLIPAALGAGVIAGALAMPRTAVSLEARLRRRALRDDRAGRLAGRVATAPRAVAGGVSEALRLARRGNPGLAGAVMWWAFDIAALWACFRAFGVAPPVAVLVLGYFVGMLANTLPLPGGIGGVDGGMIGAFAAFGVDPGLAVLAVLAYRVFAFWLPTIPGIAAYFQLRRTVGRWEREDAGEPVAPVAAPEPRRAPCPEPALAAA